MTWSINPAASEHLSSEARSALVGESAPAWLAEGLRRNEAEASVAPVGAAVAPSIQILLDARQVVAARHFKSAAEAELLQVIAGELTRLGADEDAFTTAMDASRLWQSLGLPKHAASSYVRLLDAEFHRNDAAERFELLTSAADTLIASGSAAQADELISQHLVQSSPPFSLGEEAILLALRSRSTAQMGNTARARLLLADAMSLVDGDSSPIPGLVHKVALEVAIADGNLDGIREARISVAQLSDARPETEIAAKLGEAFELLAAGELDRGEELADEVYLSSRQQRFWRSSARALYLLGTVEATRNGPSTAALQLGERAELLARERVPDAPTALLAFGVVSDLCAAGELLRAERKIAETAPDVNSPADQLDLQQAETLVALRRGHTKRAHDLLVSSDSLADLQTSAQDSGYQNRLWAELHRQAGRSDLAAEASHLALRWFDDSPNETMLRDTVLEAVRCHSAAEGYDAATLMPHINQISTRHPAGVAFSALCHAELRGDRSGLLAAADLADSTNLKYEALMSRLSAQRISSVDQVGANELVRRAVACGADWIAGEVGRLIEERTSEDPTRGLPITTREAEVLSLISAGLTNKDVASQLGITHRTASSHVSSILSKLDVHNRAEAATLWTKVRTSAYGN